MQITRRTLLAGLGAAAVSSAIPVRPSMAAVSDDSYATLIDLTSCDGCPGQEMPACVSSCRKGNSARFPEPDKNHINDYWPQKMHEDWSEKRDVHDRLTPYNWIFVDNLEVEGKTLHLPRRCMHCDSPACVKLCPFGTNHKTKEGPVYIDPMLCFGGAKCRTVCPWSVPQRQAGVGIYTYWEKFMPVGGGVMYKCDLCRDRLAQGLNPYCVDACPKKAMLIGNRREIFAEAEKRASEINGFLYGMDENGGTSTIYVSPVSFEAIDKAILAKAKNPAKAMRMHRPDNMLEKQKGWALASIAAPVIGAFAAFAATTAREGKK
jgi:formate dehydrogenase iron-sulfur subunit